MAYELKPGQGTIFKNDKKSDNHPDYRGTIKTPDGKDLDLSLWVKEGQKGKYFSVSVKEPYQKPDYNSTPSTSVETGKEDGDDLPF